MLDVICNMYFFTLPKIDKLTWNSKTLLRYNQNHLSSIVESIVEKLRYYDELEDITKLFNSPGENICEQPEFVPKLKRLDECLEYMQNNVCLIFLGVIKVESVRESSRELISLHSCPISIKQPLTLQWLLIYFFSRLNSYDIEILNSILCVSDNA